MTDYRKIDALAKDVARANRLAAFLLRVADMSWTDWELDFLAAMESQRDVLSTRQAEKLVELEDAALWFSSVEGFSVRLLVQNCFLQRADLAEEDDIAFVERLKAEGTTRLRRRALHRLLRCARALGVIEPYMGRTLNAQRPEAA